MSCGMNWINRGHQPIGMTGYAIQINARIAAAFDLRSPALIRLERRERATHSLCLRWISSRFYGDFLKGIQKNDQFVEFTKMDLSFLLKNNFDALWLDTMNKAIEIVSISQIPDHDSKSYKIYYE